MKDFATILALAKAKREEEERKNKLLSAQRYAHDLEPRLENFINCCGENHTENLKIILTNYPKELVSQPEKIFNAYLNYSATGHNEVLVLLNDFVQKNDLIIKDENFECVRYLLHYKKEKEFKNLLDSGIWDLNLLKDFLIKQIKQSDNKEDKDFKQYIAVGLEKHMLNRLTGPGTNTHKSTFKL